MLTRRHRARFYHRAVIVRREYLPLATLALALVVAGCVAAGQLNTPPPGRSPTLAECQVFPPDHIWNRAVTDLDVHPSSDDWVDTIGRSKTVHADFGSGLWEGSPIGIPYATVDGTQPKVEVEFYYPGESDPGPYPLFAAMPVEGGGDRHALIVDTDACVLYEVFDVSYEGGAWHGGSGAVFDLAGYDLRPDGWTSADAAGLPILPGLVRFEEVEAGAITHAIRFTAPQTRNEYVWPARHQASNLSGSQYPPLGQRFRLKASFDTSGFSEQARVVAVALKTYGMILADNGSSWYLSGAPDERWDNDALRDLKSITGDDFEAVDVSGLMIDPDSGRSR